MSLRSSLCPAPSSCPRTPAWPSEEWFEEWQRLTGKEWTPGPTAWDTFFSMAHALHHGTQCVLKDVKRPNHALLALFKKWANAQTAESGLLFPDSFTPYVTAFPSVFYKGFSVPAGRRCILRWCKALSRHPTPQRETLQEFQEGMLLHVLRALSIDTHHASSLKPLTVLIEAWLDTAPAPHRRHDLVESLPHPLLVYHITRRHPNSITPRLLTAAGILAGDSGKHSVWNRAEFKWNKHDMLLYAELLETLPSFSKGSPLPRVFPETHWLLSVMNLQTLHLNNFKKGEFASAVRLLAALKGRPFTREYKARALAFCFTRTLKVTMKNVFERLQHAESLWGIMAPDDLSPRFEHYITGRLQKLSEKLEISQLLTNPEEFKCLVEVWMRRMTALRLTRTLNASQAAHAPDQKQPYFLTQRQRL